MNEKQYYYLNGTAQMGPFSLETLRHAPITPGTMVWNASLPDWVEARSLPELQALFAASSYGRGATYSANPPLPSTSQPAYQTGPPPSAGYQGGNYAAGNFTPPFRTPGEARPPMPENYMVWAVLATVFCCLPLGIVSVISASKVSSAYYVGDYAGAQRAARDAKKWATWSALAAVIVIGLYILVYVVIFAVAGIAAVWAGT
ncbi:MAG: CD225/dispanin family protein [Tannerella sp.]|nr:CD225/dispanin family protein [Tannerella sp.]